VASRVASGLGSRSHLFIMPLVSFPPHSHVLLCNITGRPMLIVWALPGAAAARQ
jgi:hypothetical protein